MKSAIRLLSGTTVIFLSLACSLFETSTRSSAQASNTPDPTKGADIPPATAMPEEKPAPDFGDWPAYINDSYNFQLKYPPGGEIQDQYDVYARIGLPFEEGTTLADKYLGVNVYLGLDSCGSQVFGGDPSQSKPMQIGGEDWLKEEGSDAGAGSGWTVTSYSTAWEDWCINLDFVVVATNPDMYDPTPRPFNKDAETAIFTDIVSTFEWLG